jgi:hypothetical protein
LAFTPLGAPVTWITGPADGRGLDGRGLDGRGLDGAAGGRVPVAEACRAAGRGLFCPAAGAQAATPPAMTATAVSETIRALSRMP